MMTPAEHDLLAADVAATTGVTRAAARLLLRLAEGGALAEDALTAPEEQQALAVLENHGAAETAGGLVRHRPGSWRLQRITVRGARLCVQTCGEGEAVVLAPAFGTYRCLWGTPWTHTTGQLADFSRRYSTVCVDYRGTGCSDITAAPYSLEEFAADLNAVLDQLAIRRAHLIGVSLGGGVVLRAALARPERVASLVLCATNAGEIDAATRARAEMFLRLASTRPLEWAMRTYLRSPLVAATPQTVDAMLALGRRSVRTLDNFVNLYRANVFRSSVRERLREIRVPTLVLVGERDELYFQEEAQALAHGIAGASLITVPAAGHLVCEHNPAFFNRAVLEFLDRQTPVRTRPSSDEPAAGPGPTRDQAAVALRSSSDSPSAVAVVPASGVEGHG